MDKKYSLYDLKTVLKKVMEDIKDMESDQLPEIIHNLIKPYNNRLQTIEKIAQLSKFNLNFIGEVGVGKTTFLSHLLGLVDELNKNENIDDITLLKTGIGRTTLCETIIKQVNETTNITIEGMNIEEFNGIVDDFADSILSINNVNILSEELKVALLNMSKFPVELSKIENEKLKEEKLDKKEFADKRKQMILKKQIHYIYNEAEEHELDKFNIEKDKLIKSIHKNIDYINRTKSKVFFDSKDNFKEWLKKNFESINAGKLEECPFPKRIVININKDDFNLNLPDNIASVVDSKGMDGIGVREDIIKSVFSIDNIIVICDRIESYGNILNRDWLKSSLTRNEDINHKCIILGLEREEELGDEERFYNMEKKERQIIGQNQLLFEMTKITNNNLYFADSMHGLGIMKKKIMEIQEEEYKNELLNFKDKINSIIKEMYNSLTLEVKEIRNQLEALRENKLDDKMINKLSKCKTEIKKYINDLNNERDYTYNDLENRLKEFHVGVVRGSVNRNGSYSNCNIYSESSQLGINILEELNKDKIYAFKKFIDNTEIFDRNNQIEKTIFNSINYKLEQEYISIKNRIAQDYSNLLEQGISQSSIWNVMYYFWGDHKGSYRERVINTIMNEIDRSKINQILDKKNYKEKLFKSIFEFINI
ncbi:hypothetical protein ST12_06235 [Clostridium botulinum]|uniref:hypothetical protein n=1 Tax=Clostridium botulinum TaxID=1491 RepID=UPI000174EAF1|nr:hypothetical protein [Clostridium botulinum]ACD52961.1 conserved hypothetical protein [Clostridium botulinum E3 str. Alaska E43]AJF29301.1 hypothetical protein ST13_06235 [Clostridium botulinum]AJF32362.1 hypothetical protein ST12_06235 [Clostridium botulinum]MBY6789564.1 hypothetical protein [Clostridium botulinum]MBY6817247.1 hypothetical protein [Clostridium botulinum]